MDRWPLSEPHQTLQNHPDIKSWAASVKHILIKYKSQYKFIFVCHNKREIQLAKDLDSSIPISVPKTAEDYSRIASNAVAGIVCRIHAAIPLASVGVASVVVGDDTRLYSVEALGLPIKYVEDVNPSWLEEALLNLIKNHRNEKERLAKLKEKTLLEYTNLIKKFVRN